METASKVFLVAENRLLREALARLLSKRADITLTGALSFTPNVLEQLIASASHILLLDSAVIARTGLDFVREVRQAVPELRLILIGMENDEETFLKAVARGVVGYVYKDASAADVLAAVRAISQGQAVCPPELVTCLFRQVARNAQEAPSVRVSLRLGLTRRQQQLIPLIARGLTNKEIATQLNLSEQTVKNHIYRMMQKVGADERLRVVEICTLPPHKT